MPFTDGQLVTAADLNNFSVTTVTTSGAATIGSTLDVGTSAQFGTGNVNLILSTGKIAALTGTYIDNLDGTALTGIPRSQNRDVTEADVTNTTTETTVYSFSVPGGTLSTNAVISGRMVGDYLNNTAGSKNFTVNVKYGATTILNFAVTGLGVLANRRQLWLSFWLYAANATNSQRAFGELRMADTGAVAGASVAVAAGAGIIHQAVHNAIAEDSTAAKDLAITFTHSAADGNLSAKAYIVQVQSI